MGEKVDVLGVPVFPGTLSQARERVFYMLEEGTRGNAVFSVNPEIVMAGSRDRDFKEILKRGNLNLPDGIGIVLGSRLLGEKIPERVAGYDLVRELLPECARRGYRVYLLGGKPGVAREAAKRIEKEYPGLEVVGNHHGYFSPGDEEKVKNEISISVPDVLLVGLGFPRQERFIDENAKELEIPVSLAVGGTLDVLAGRTRRAPRFWQRLGLEWLYRIIMMRRWDRFVSLPRFVLLVLFARLKGVDRDA